jgi:hypothetical protein
MSWAHWGSRKAGLDSTLNSLWFQWLDQVNADR